MPLQPRIAFHPSEPNMQIRMRRLETEGGVVREVNWDEREHTECSHDLRFLI